jgi:hypothetical protein
MVHPPTTYPPIEPPEIEGEKPPKKRKLKIDAGDIATVIVALVLIVILLIAARL